MFFTDVKLKKLWDWYYHGPATQLGLESCTSVRLYGLGRKTSCPIIPNLHKNKQIIGHKKCTAKRVIWRPTAFGEVRHGWGTSVCHQTRAAPEGCSLSQPHYSDPALDQPCPALSLAVATGLPRWGGNYRDHTHKLSILKGCTV